MIHCFCLARRKDNFMIVISYYCINTDFQPMSTRMYIFVFHSKVQARFAFATYLSRVQQRLMSETGTTEQEDVDTANEQMVWING